LPIGPHVSAAALAASLADKPGLEMFQAACRMGLEGLVSKRRDRPYQAGRSKHWVKVKNRQHPAMSRVMD
jgi:bifunctional non-homologous end joining protein LigD